MGLWLKQRVGIVFVVRFEFFNSNVFTRLIYSLLASFTNIEARKDLVVKKYYFYRTFVTNNNVLSRNYFQNQLRVV